MLRGVYASALTGVLLLLATGTAAAATPQGIYRDLADNGRLDGKYSQADVDRALRNPSILNYARPERTQRQPQVHRGTVPSAGASGETGALPFSGLDLALFALFGAPLLLVAGSMRRVVRTRIREG
jgi:hypothetical protein